MSIPGEVKVGPFVYRVEQVDIVDDRDREKDGEFDHPGQTIRVAANSHPAVAREIFFHELMHAVDWLMGTDLDEATVSRLSNGLLMVLRDNGLLVE